MPGGWVRDIQCDCVLQRENFRMKPPQAQKECFSECSLIIAAKIGSVKGKRGFWRTIWGSQAQNG
jgi:hypothetical protein